MEAGVADESQDYCHLLPEPATWFWYSIHITDKLPNIQMHDTFQGDYTELQLSWWLYILLEDL